MKLAPRHCQVLNDVLEALPGDDNAELRYRVDAMLNEEGVPERPRRQHELVVHVASDQPLAGSTVMDGLDAWLEEAHMDVTACTSAVTPTTSMHVAVFVDPTRAQGEGYRAEHLAWQEQVIADRDS